jgi:hypothetical protein
VTTTLDWIEETKRHLLSGDRENLNRLNGAINSSATTLVYEFDQGGIIAGAVLEIDLESMYVWSVSTGTKTATVQRGFNGSTAASHSDDAIIRVNPRFPHWTIFVALNQELADLSSPANGLFQVNSEDVVTTAGVVGYDLTLSDDNFLGIIEVHAEIDTQSDFWKRVDNYRVMQEWNVVGDVGVPGLILAEHWVGSGTIRVTYRQTFTPLPMATYVTDDVNTVSGLPASCNDIPPLGAAVRLAMPRGIKRSFDESQGEPRRASEVEALAMVQNASALLAYRDRRIAAEVSRLHHLYPVRQAR